MNSRLILICSAYVACATFIRADSIRTSVTCTAFGFAPVTGTNACSGGGSWTVRILATGGVSATLTYNAYSVSSTIDRRGRCGLCDGRRFQSESTVAFTADVAGTVLTAGPREVDTWRSRRFSRLEAISSGYNFQGAIFTAIGGVQGTCTPGGVAPYVVPQFDRFIGFSAWLGDSSHALSWW